MGTYFYLLMRSKKMAQEVFTNREKGYWNDPDYPVNWTDREFS